MTVAVRTDGVLQWILPDHLGSTSTTANADGREAPPEGSGRGYPEQRDPVHSVRSRSTPTGREIRSSQGITPTKYRYTGQLAKAELGLDYYVARWYDPYLIHWIQPDSVIPDVTNPMDFDRYSYTRNNPIALQIAVVIVSMELLPLPV